MTFGEHEVLAALTRSGPPYRLKPTELVSALVLSSGAVTNRIDRVEEAGLMERLPDPAQQAGKLGALGAGERPERNGRAAEPATRTRRAPALTRRDPCDTHPDGTRGTVLGLSGGEGGTTGGSDHARLGADRGEPRSRNHRGRVQR